MAEGICDALEMEGYAVIIALNGLEALARLEESQVDLILVDIMMPLMDGYEFYESSTAFRMDDHTFAAI